MAFTLSLDDFTGGAFHLCDACGVLGDCHSPLDCAQCANQSAEVAGGAAGGAPPPWRCTVCAPFATPPPHVETKQATRCDRVLSDVALFPSLFLAAPTLMRASTARSDEVVSAVTGPGQRTASGVKGLLRIAVGSRVAVGSPTIPEPEKIFPCCRDGAAEWPKTWVRDAEIATKKPPAPTPGVVWGAPFSVEVRPV
jgi:hypothetical protein